MLRVIRLASIAVLACALSGCGKTDSPPAADATNASPAEAQAAVEQDAPPVDLSKLTPQETVIHYLTAVKEGDEELVGSLLTEAARRKTTELNIAVAPPGGATANFSVGDMEFVTPAKDTAHVACIWTDVDEQGKPLPLRIVWVVRHEAAGWRVAGMITRMKPDQPLLVLDFEDPEEVIRRQAAIRQGQAKEEVTSGEQPPGANPPGTNPSTPPAGADVSQAAPAAPVTATSQSPMGNPLRQARDVEDDGAIKQR